MNALVRIVGERAVADSRDVAAQFAKRHDHLLRSIDAMVRDAPELSPNFGAQLYEVDQNGATRRYRRFDMDRKGFMMLVMGFNGAKALKIRSQWIDAFDAMEQALLQRQEPINDDTPIAALPSLHEATRIVAVGEAFRRIYGTGAARWIMQVYGLPAPPAELAGPGEGDVPALSMVSNVAEWVGQCCAVEPGAMESATALYRSYQDWCAEKQRVPDTQTGFGRALGRSGVVGRKAPSGRVIRVGLKLLT